MRTTGKQCGLAATGDYQPSLRSPWLVAIEDHREFLLQHLTHAKLDRVLKDKVDCLYRFGLADTVYAA
ncbi:hypothetical protein, partial [Thiolapillus sp.]|uniref:hypothetical protein n=1 Tax=Thiolapillus sp. TaxID=2017437 RepID=UPI003AF7AF55